MKKKNLKAYIIAGCLVAAVVFFALSSRQSWTLIPGTGGIHYDKSSLRREGGMVYAMLRNDNPEALSAASAREIYFKAALYCGRGKVRTLSQNIHKMDGTVVTDSENHLEEHPERDPLNETHDLADISTSPSLSSAYWALCRDQ